MIIFREGDTANTIYIIITGEVEITIAKKPSICLKKGEIFG
jgi:CRP-like cAMP-binding protein